MKEELSYAERRQVLAVRKAFMERPDVEKDLADYKKIYSDHFIAVKMGENVNRNKYPGFTPPKGFIFTASIIYGYFKKKKQEAAAAAAE